VGYAKELNGDRKMLLLAGSHQIVIRQAWYHDDIQQVLLEPAMSTKSGSLLQKILISHLQARWES
jgi:hypothetical protein